MIKRALIASFTQEFVDPIKKVNVRSAWYSRFTNHGDTLRPIGLSYNDNLRSSGFKLLDMLTTTANSPVYSGKQRSIKHSW